MGINAGIKFFTSTNPLISPVVTYLLRCLQGTLLIKCIRLKSFHLPVSSSLSQAIKRHIPHRCSKIVGHHCLLSSYPHP
ncbi:hypothetical protein C3428_16375 [Citrobacter braakii]|nr:hypothetical protein C3428_16375 [Citrobacter braakii]